MKIIDDKAKQQECTTEVMKWLHHVWELQGRGEVIQPDPFYERNNVLTEDIVTMVLTSITNLMHNEFVKYPGYHYPAQNVKQGEVLLVPPPYLKMPYQTQFAIVQGIDRIMQSYRAEEVVIVETTPELTSLDGGDWY